MRLARLLPVLALLLSGCALLDRGPERLRVEGADVFAGDERFVLESVSHYLLPFYLLPSGGPDPALRETTTRTYDDRGPTLARLREYGANTVRVPLGSVVGEGDP